MCSYVGIVEHRWTNEQNETETRGWKRSDQHDQTSHLAIVVKHYQNGRRSRFRQSDNTVGQLVLGESERTLLNTVACTARAFPSLAFRPRSSCFLFRIVQCSYISRQIVTCVPLLSLTICVGECMTPRRARSRRVQMGRSAVGEGTGVRSVTPRFRHSSLGRRLILELNDLATSCSLPSRVMCFPDASTCGSLADGVSCGDFACLDCWHERNLTMRLERNISLFSV